MMNFPRMRVVACDNGRVVPAGALIFAIGTR